MASWQMRGAYVLGEGVEKGFGKKEGREGEKGEVAGLCGVEGGEG